MTFTVTSGDATFAPPSVKLFGKAGRRNAPTNVVLVTTDANGVATAPVLNAGPKAGPIEVTASAGSAPDVKSTVFHLSATAVAPTAPKIDSLTNGDGHVTVGFSGATAGTSPITSYEVSAHNDTDTTAPAVTAHGPNSPITVTGLVNGDTYQFTVTATSKDGTSPPSAPSGRLNVGVAPVIVSGPGNGVLGHPYDSRFTVTGAPPPTVT